MFLLITLRAIHIRTGKVFGVHYNSNKMTAALYEIYDSVYHNTMNHVIGLSDFFYFWWYFVKRFFGVAIDIRTWKILKDFSSVYYCCLSKLLHHLNLLILLFNSLHYFASLMHRGKELSLEERRSIHELFNACLGISSIASKLKRSKSTTSNIKIF
jgi:hypothetical protein